MVDLLERLNKVRRSGSGWVAACPAHDDTNPSLSVSRGDDGRWLVHCHSGCGLDAILGALSLETKDLFPENGNGNTPSRQEIDAVYRYDEVFEVVRYRNPKGFRQRRPDGKGGYIWNLKGVKPRPYRLNDLKGHDVVLVCEGEKDVDRLWSLGIAATCNAGGAGKWKKAHADHLVEAGVTHVHVVPDDDEPGRAHAEHVASVCAAAGLTVKLLTLPDGDA